VIAIVVMLAAALTVGLPADVAVAADVLDVPSVAVLGGETVTQTSKLAPATRSGVAVIAVPQLELEKVTGNVPPVELKL